MKQICIFTTTNQNAYTVFKSIGFVKPNIKDFLLHFARRNSNKSVIYSDDAIL